MSLGPIVRERSARAPTTGAPVGHASLLIATSLPLRDGRSAELSAEMGSEMVAQVARIVAGAVNERRLASAQERVAKQIHARRIDDDAAVVSDLALVIEDGHFEPR